MSFGAIGTGMPVPPEVQVEHLKALQVQPDPEPEEPATAVEPKAELPEPPIPPKRRRARNHQGHFKPDDPATPENEAWTPET